MGQALTVNNPQGTVSTLDSAGNAVFTGNITLGKTASVLIPQPGSVTLYSADGTSVSMVDSTGAKTTVSSGTGTTTFTSLNVNPGPLNVSGTLNLTGATSPTTVITAGVNLDTNARYIVNADGTMGWGPGTTGTDTNLYRATTGQLNTDGKFSVGTTLVTGSTINGMSWPQGQYFPVDHGFLAWSFDVASFGSSAVPAAGVIQLVKVTLRQAATINNLYVHLATSGTGLTSGQCFAALYDSGGTRRGVTADQSTNWAGAANLQTMALTAPFAASAGNYWVAILQNGSANVAFGRQAGISGGATLLNAGLTASTARFATNGSGQTTAPASITPASNATSTNAFWAAIG